MEPMISMDVVPRQRSAQLRPEEWEAWKSLIRTKYLVDDLEVDAVVEELHRHGLKIK